MFNQLPVCLSFGCCFDHSYCFGKISSPVLPIAAAISSNLDWNLNADIGSLVNKNKCLEVGNLLNLKEFVITGNSKSSRNIVENKIISDCCEAIIGAIYLDRGFEISKIFILKQWKNLINNAETTFVDAKTRLQEYSLKNFKMLPIYKLVSNTGPRHKPKFKVGVKLKNSTYVYAIGSSKKIAEQSAASELLKKINQQ